MGLDPDEYPLLPEIEESKMLRLPSDLLKTMIKQTSYAVSTNESTPILTGVLWNISGDKLKFIACDRHRLASREVTVDNDHAHQLPNIAISGRTLNELSKILPDQNSLIDIVISDNQVLFKIQFDFVLFSYFGRYLPGYFQAYSTILSNQNDCSNQRVS